MAAITGIQGALEQCFQAVFPLGQGGDMGASTGKTCRDTGSYTTSEH